LRRTFGHRAIRARRIRRLRVAQQRFNGFTFAAIGSGTRMSYLQTLALDDSYEFFGGSSTSTTSSRSDG
jgi:hypothetical protein